MDYIITKWINSLAGQKLWIDAIGVVFSDFLIFVIPFIIFLVYFFSKKRKKVGYIAARIILAVILVAVLNYAISHIITRPRPFVSHLEIYQLAKFNASSKDFSFPSDHTALAFAMAISVLVNWRKFGLILLIPAVMVGLGRIFVGVHYPTDVIAGIIIAIISVLLVNIVLKRFKIFKLE